MREKYHILYVPISLWNDVVHQTNFELSKKPSQVALDFIRDGLLPPIPPAIQPVSRPRGRPSKHETAESLCGTEKKHTKKQTDKGKVLYLYDGTNWNLIEEQREVDHWRNIFKKMGQQALDREQFILRLPEDFMNMTQSELDLVKGQAEEQYYDWKGWIENENEKDRSYRST